MLIIFGNLFNIIQKIIYFGNFVYFTHWMQKKSQISSELFFGVQFTLQIIHIDEMLIIIYSKKKAVSNCFNLKL